MGFERTATRLWKRLTPAARQAAATRFWEEPDPESAATAIGAIVKARRLRPQVARALGEADRTRALATILDPGESLAATLLVALHLGERRQMLVAFLDALGLPHEDGVLDDEVDEGAISDEAAAKGWDSLAQAFPEADVLVYLNTLWLQDPDRWEGLERLAEQRAS